MKCNFKYGNFLVCLTNTSFVYIQSRKILP